MRAIVNVSVGGWYPRGAARQLSSLRRHGFFGEILQWVGEFPPFSPTHEEIPYAFKPLAFAAARRAGADAVLWMDASCYAIAPLDALFEQIERVGFVLFASGNRVGHWSSDRALKAMGLSRATALEIPEISACVMGFDYRHQVAHQFMAYWTYYAMDGMTFPGEHKNVGGSVSLDGEVLGHRHDQTAASVVAYRLGMNLTHMPKFVAYQAMGYTSESLILNQGL